MNDTVVSAPEADEPMTGIAEYSATERGLAELRSRLQDRVYDVATTKGMTEAKTDRAELRTLRVNLESMRKEIKAPALERCRQIDSEAKRITTEIAAIEDPIDEQIKQAEERKAEAKRERERAEADRLRKINDEIANIERMPLDFMNATAEELRDGITKLEADDLADFDEVHAPTAKATREASLEKLTAMLEARIAAEAEAERLAAERAELDRLRAEDDARRKEQEAADAARREAEESDRQAKAQADEHIADLKSIPAALVGRSSEILRGAIEEVEGIDPNHSRFGDRGAEADNARGATLSRLREMLEASEAQEKRASEQAERQRQLDEQEARQRQQREEAEAAERTRREREEAEAAERTRQQEEDAIQRATLREAAQEAHRVLIDLGHAEHITTRKLAAALAKEQRA